MFRRVDLQAIQLRLYPRNRHSLRALRDNARQPYSREGFLFFISNTDKHRNCHILLITVMEESTYLALILVILTNNYDFKDDSSTKNKGMEIDSVPRSRISCISCEAACRPPQLAEAVANWKLPLGAAPAFHEAVFSVGVPTSLLVFHPQLCRQV